MTKIVSKKGSKTRIVSRKSKKAVIKASKTTPEQQFVFYSVLVATVVIYFIR